MSFPGFLLSKCFVKSNSFCCCKLFKYTELNYLIYFA